MNANEIRINQLAGVEVNNNGRIKMVLGTVIGLQYTDTTVEYVVRHVESGERLAYSAAEIFATESWDLAF